MIRCIKSVIHEIKHPVEREGGEGGEKVSASSASFISHVDLHCVLFLCSTATVNGTALGVDFKSDYSVHFPANRSENTHIYDV